MDYSKKELIQSTKELYNNIHSCVANLVKARLDHDSTAEGEALFKMESLITATQQQLGCVIDFLEEEKPMDFFEREAVQFCFDKGLNTTPYIAKTIAKYFYERDFDL